MPRGRYPYACQQWVNFERDGETTEEFAEAEGQELAAPDDTEE
jgi:hypothetical protein